MSGKHPLWCDDCYCWKCDSQTEDDCFSSHSNQVVHRWLLTSNAFGFNEKSDDNYVWIQQSHNDKQPTAWCAHSSLDTKDGYALHPKTFVTLIEQFKIVAKLLGK